VTAFLATLGLLALLVIAAVTDWPERASGWLSERALDMIRNRKENR
jgi:hypothetical protein